jgi:hypothetical protein
LGPRVGVDGCGKFRFHRDSIPGPSSPWLVAIPTELSRPTETTHNAPKQVGDEVLSVKPCVKVMCILLVMLWIIDVRNFR